ncbi:MAG: PGPGW domain-containing protein [Candidatus Competibacterales bacterium]|nr:PGPGW domain-containing protein [Candidatus Competibacterales bacterium]
MTELLTWIQGNETLLWWLGIGSLLTFVGSLVAIPVLVSRIPADYFVRPDHRPMLPYFGRHPLLRVLGLLLKNLFGIVFVLAGIAMLVLPGQGILSLLIGISLMNFPGKRALELWLIRQPAVHRGINWIRRRGGHPPLEVPAAGRG